MKYIKIFEEHNFLKKLAKEIVELGFNKIKIKEEHNLFFFIKQFLGETNLTSNVIDKICDSIKYRYYQNENHDWIHEKTPELISKFYQMAITDATNDIYELILNYNA